MGVILVIKKGYQDIFFYYTQPFTRHFRHFPPTCLPACRLVRGLNRLLERYENKSLLIKGFSSLLKEAMFMRMYSKLIGIIIMNNGKDGFSGSKGIYNTLFEESSGLSNPSPDKSFRRQLDLETLHSSGVLDFWLVMDFYRYLTPLE
jgi:hypothetical protein